MHLMYFTEQPMSAYDEHAAQEGVTALLFSNANFDSEAGAQLYRDRLTEYQFAEEVGVDGIMLNEHHNAPFCMQAKCNIWASVLAGATRARQNRAARQPPAAGRQPDPAGRGARDDRHDLAGPPRFRLRARRRHRAARHRRQPRLQPRALRGGPRPDRRSLDPPRPLPLGGQPLPAPRRQPLGHTAPAAPPARLDPRRALARDGDLGRQAPLPLHRAQHHCRGDQAHLADLRRRRARGRLRPRPRKPRLPAPRPLRRHDREGAGERLAVHVDAG